MAPFEPQGGEGHIRATGVQGNTAIFAGSYYYNAPTVLEYGVVTASISYVPNIDIYAEPQTSPFYSVINATTKLAPPG